MTLFDRGLYAALMLASLVAAHSQQRDIAGPVVSGTGLIGGIVTTDDTIAQPIRRALLTLTGGGLRGSLQTVTSDDGRFEFPSLPAGRYTVTAQKPAYLVTYYGGKRPGFGPGTPIALEDGQRLSTIAMTLTRGGVVAGTVRDENGSPISSAQVSLMRPVIADGDRKLQSANPSWETTDDRGRYRIYGIPPGEYTVVVRGGGETGMTARLVSSTEIEAVERQLRGLPPSPASSPPPIEMPQVRRAGTYYPDAVDPAFAQTFSLAAGEERLGVDIRHQFVRVVRAEGTFAGLPGQLMTSALVGLANASSQSLFTSPGGLRPDSTGHFVVNGLTPGRWIIFGGTSADSITPVSADAPGERAQLWTETEFTVVDQNVTSIVVQFLPGTTVAGRVTFRGTHPPPDFTKVSVRLSALPRIPGAGVSVAPSLLARDGSFSIKGVAPGRYQLAVAGTNPWSLRAAMLGNVDVLDKRLDVTQGQDVSGLEVLFIDQPAELSGTLTDRVGRPAPEYVVVLFSTDKELWSAPRRVVGPIKVGSDGHYAFAGVPPGDYFLCALTDVDGQQLKDPAFLEQLSAASLKISLSEGEKTVENIRIGR